MPVIPKKHYGVLTMEFKSTCMGISLCLITILAASPAVSQDEDNWDFNLAPLYLWAISIDGDLGIRGRTAEASIDFQNVWNNLEGVFTMRFNGIYRKKYGFILDYNYLDLGTEKDSRKINTEVSFTSQIINLAGTYRLLDGAHTLDGVAGIRYNNLDAGINLRNLGINLGGDQDWVDPIVGLRYNYTISDQWSLLLYGDIGGFSVSSNFTWQGLGLISYQPWKNVALVAGYRAIGTDYENGSGNNKFVFDATIYGPILGFDIHW